MQISVRVQSFLFSVVSLIVFSLAQSTAAQAQTAATLTGMVTDPRGASIAGAQISVEQIPSAGEPVHAVSSSDGRFALTLAPGHDRIIISRDSFAPVVQEITIAAGETREWNVRMALEPLSAKVVVTAQTLPLDADSSPAPVTILTYQEIEQRGATSLPDLLATQPGFSLGRTGPEGGQTSLFLDGGNSNYTKVLVDGVPVNQPGGLIDFSNFTIDNIEKIEVVHGAESALYGSDAMDGVIQIFTHRGKTRVPELTAFGEGGNFSTGRGGAELSGLLGRFDYSAGVSDMETQGQGSNDAFRNRALSGNFGWRFSDAARMSLGLRDNVSDAGTPGPTLIEPPNLDQRFGLHKFSANLHAEFASGAHWRYQVNGLESYYRQTDANLLVDFYTPPDSSGNVTCFGPRSPQAVLSAFCDFLFSDFFQYNRTGLTGQATYLTKTFNITAGYEYEIENGFLSSIGMHARRNNQAGFLDAQWQPIARLTLSAGARAEDNATYGTRVVPRTGASYAVRIAQGAFGDTRLRISYGKGIVEPRFDQTYGLNACFPGNPNLLPERSWTLHAGIEQKLGSDRVHLTADYFESRFHDIISFQLDPQTFCGTFFNTNLARARGAVFSSEARLSRWLSAAVNYTYQSTRTLSAPSDSLNIDPNYLVGSPLLRRPKNSGNVMLNASYRRMNWNLNGYFTGPRADYNYPGQIMNPGYARIDLGASYSVSHGLTLYGRIANLADKHYQDAYGFPALGREFRIGVKYTTRHE
jgi:vitamin B12 transporter